MQRFLESLATSLVTDGEIGSLPEAHSQYVVKMLNRFSETLQALFLFNADSELKRLTDPLPVESSVRVATAPETYSKMAAGDNCQLSDFYWQSLNAERALRSQIPLKEPCWSALGDVYFTPSIEGRSTLFYLAPTLANSGIPIDMCSIHARQLNALPSPFEPYEAPVMKDMERDLSRAFDAIRVTSPSSSTRICLFVRVVILRRDLKRPGWGSSSSLSHVGRVLFRNPDRASFETLVEGLLHESIHATINAIACVAPFYTDGSEINQILCVSPWTGNGLSLRTYFHAVFVWAALKHFWSIVKDDGLFDPVETIRLYELACSGFKKVRIIDQLLPYRSLFNTTALELLHAVASLKS
jgi:hypothetical protein